MRRFVKKCVSLLLLSVMLAAAALPAAAADSRAGVGWSDGEEGFAVRITSYGGEVSRVTAGERFSVQLWIRGCDPAAVSVPLSWDPSIAEVVNENTGEAVSTGRKTESDLVRGAGFRPGEACYDTSLNDDYEPLYWNGKPVFTQGNDGGETAGYPYINNETGFAKFLYYTSSPTRGSEPQLFLEVHFLAVKEGDPKLRFATTAADGSGTDAFDPGSPKGLQASFTDRTDGNIDDVDRVESEVYTDRVPFPAFRITDGSEMDQEPVVPPDSGSGSGSSGAGGGQNGQAGAVPQPESVAKPPSEAVLKQAEHLKAWPAGYETPTECTAVIHRTDREKIFETDEYEIDEDALYATVVQAGKIGAQAGRIGPGAEKTGMQGEENGVQTGKTAEKDESAAARLNRSGAVLVRMPEQIIVKDEYAVSIPAGPLKAAAEAGVGQIYLETPQGYVGIECAAAAPALKEGAMLRAAIRAAGCQGQTASIGSQSQEGKSSIPVQSVQGEGLVRGGVSVSGKCSVSISLRSDGKELTGLDGPTLRLLLPYVVKETDALPTAYTDRAFGTAVGAAASAPLAVCRYDAKMQMVLLQAPAGGTILLKDSRPAEFIDLDEVSWAKNDIGRLSQLGIVSGTGQGSFRPEESVTREQFAKMVTAALGLYEPSAQMPFQDIERSNPFYHYIGSAAAKGIVSGTAAERFGGQSPISRQDLAVMAYRASQKAGLVLPQTTAVPVFKDDAQIEPYAKDAVYALARAGIISGTGEGRFSPAGTATRAEASRILGALWKLTDQLL